MAREIQDMVRMQTQNVPAIGGKRMAIKPRNRSEEHIAMFVESQDFG